MNVIERLYRGRFDPIESTRPDSEEYREAIRKLSDINEELPQLLNGEQKKLWDAYQDATTIATDAYNLAFYRQGMAFGVRLLLELFSIDLGDE